MSVTHCIPTNDVWYFSFFKSILHSLFCPLFCVFCFTGLCLHLYYVISSNCFMLTLLFSLCIPGTIDFPLSTALGEFHETCMLFLYLFLFLADQNLLITLWILLWFMVLFRSMLFVSKYWDVYPPLIDFTHLIYDWVVLYKCHCFLFRSVYQILYS